MTDPIDPAEYVARAALLIDLPLAPEHRLGVIENFSRIIPIAQLVTEFSLAEDVEAAPIFEP